jgi:diketogulonate reductase-like aldo/keto reductase
VSHSIARRPFGPSAVPVPLLGQGTWQMEGDARAACVAALRAGLDLGMTHVDTAELYGSGAVEDLVGEAIAGRRDEVFLVSKVLPENATRRGAVAACERSLRRLRTDALDLYLLHWRGPHPLEETFRGFDDLLRDGKIRAFGVSNFDVEDLDEALAVAGEGRIACNQVLYHLQERHIEHAVIPWCRARGVAVVGYSPFGSGAFPTARSAGGRLLGELARARGATPRQVALAFLARDGAFLIPKSARAEHVRENAGAAAIALSADEIARLDAAFPRASPDRALPVI